MSVTTTSLKIEGERITAYTPANAKATVLAIVYFNTLYILGTSPKHDKLYSKVEEKAKRKFGIKGVERRPTFYVTIIGGVVVLRRNEKRVGLSSIISI